MNDIIERLRKASEYVGTHRVHIDAANEIERLRKLERWFARYNEPDSPPPYADVVVRLATAEAIIDAAREWTTTHLQGTTLEKKIAAYDKEFGDG